MQFRQRSPIARKRCVSRYAKGEEMSFVMYSRCHQLDTENHSEQQGVHREPHSARTPLVPLYVAAAIPNLSLCLSIQSMSLPPYRFELTFEQQIFDTQTRHSMPTTRQTAMKGLTNIPRHTRHRPASCYPDIAVEDNAALYHLNVSIVEPTSWSPLAAATT